ncbi:ABC transporter substrate-binding protein [Steroidobacter sp.]|uniref:ABC transporter substrate-binding protein n=1 Tax=Steroidobacter sp. TaxID=1978227 RepID=UPI001A5A01F5|nr:ABC transporter substrate-binding protein [Steroidobacter sp.]MBL8269109.1 ABC transporter substrate-binding protein [Steroidobacter sp.]
MINRTIHAFKSLLTAGRDSLAAAAFMLVGSVLMSGCGSHQAPPPLSSEPIRIATYVWPGSYWVDVAHDKGWFREAGLNVERVDVNGKYFDSMHDVNSGKLQAMGFSQYDLVRHVAAGNDLTGVIAIDYSEVAEALIAKPGNRRLQDLRGKKVALHRGTYLEYLLSVVAERDHLKLDDLILLDVPGDEAIRQFKRGEVDAVLVWEPYVSEAKAAGGVQIFSAADFPGLTYSVFTLRRDFIDAHPREVEALVQVWHRAESFIRQHPVEACAIVARLSKEPEPYVQDLLRADRVLDAADNVRAFSYAAGFESLHGSWRRMNDFMLDRGLVTRRVDSPAHLDSRFIRALQ